MRKLIVTVAAAFIAICMNAQKVVFVPQWTAQTQFAGYYVALEKGFFADEGLEVEIKHFGSNSTESSMDQLLNGSAQIIGQQLIQAIIARADGREICNVLQLTQESGLCCVSHNPISDPVELDSLKVGRWKVGFADFCDMLEAYKGINVNWVPFINGINLYVFGAVDATLCYSYSELISLELAVGNIPEDHILRFSDFGYECPEDGLYVTEKYYKDNRETVEKFVRASKRGWDYAREHKNEALGLTKKYIDMYNITTNLEHQRRMLDEYLRLQVNEDSGKADYAPVKPEVFANIVDALINTGYIVRKVEYSDIIK